MSNIVLGTELMLFKDGKALAAATACKLTLNANTLETSSKDSGKWTSNQPAKLSWSCSSDNLFTIEDYEDLMDACIARTPIEVQFSTVQNPDSDFGKPEDGWLSENNGYKGDAIITSIDMNAPDGDNATYSISMTGSGALKKVNGAE